MRSDKFQNALGMIDPGLVKRASGKQRIRRYTRTVAMIAALLALVIITASVGWIYSRDGEGPIGAESASGESESVSDSDRVSDTIFAPVICPPSWWGDGGKAERYDPQSFEKYLLLAAEYPVMAKYPGQQYGNTPEYKLWEDDVQKQLAYRGAGAGLGEFFEKSVREFLLGRGTENSVYSPLNVYFSIAMMAELASDGERASIFSLLGVSGIEELRAQANSVWNANYRDDGVVKSVLANSVWTDKDHTYNEALLKVLKESYKASVFGGDFGSSEYDFALRSWINENTDGLVDRLSDVSLDPSAVLALVSTISFNAKWVDEFNKNLTKSGTFHSPVSDVTCEFMNMKCHMDYYRGTGFSAIKKNLIATGDVYFILPDENVSIDTMLYNNNVMSITSNPYGWKSYQYVNMSIPKFEIQSDMDLAAGLERLGVKVSVLDGIRHGAGVSMDEEGVKAAAFTMSFYGAGIPEKEIEFTLDRPFMFIITGSDGLPLFVGIVNQP